MRVLLDQNIPHPVAEWLRQLCPDWTVWHVYEMGLGGASDATIFQWAQAQQAAIITSDEDFADVRVYPPAMHWGVVRLRVWPTTVEVIQEAISRWIAYLGASSAKGRLFIVGRRSIRERS
jgi:predicted nuclease of predicted toxin-antitoxin system